MAAMMLLTACTLDNYDKGDGEYSLLVADFAEVHVDAQKRVDYIVTDDDERLPVTNEIGASSVSTADSLYRCMLYYNKVVEDGKASAEVLSISLVPCPQVKRMAADEVKTDPVKFESLWRSKNQRYVNMYLQLLTGYVNDTTAIQELAVVEDTLYQYPDSTRALHLRLHHDQKGLPTYYSTPVYFSIPTERLQADTVYFHINTFQGAIEKSIAL